MGLPRHVLWSHIQRVAIEAYIPMVVQQTSLLSTSNGGKFATVD
jgi:hypothetical protein